MEIFLIFRAIDKPLEQLKLFYAPLLIENTEVVDRLLC